MLSMEDWVTIRNLKKRNPKLGTRKIAEILGVSRNTVRKALRNESYPTYERKKKTYDRLKPFHEFIKESYLIKKQQVSVIISNLKSKGYNGSDTAVYRYINDNFKEVKSNIERKTYQPYETDPGQQMQYDWSEYRVKLGKETTKVYVHQLICGFSRKKIFDASLDISQSSIFNSLSEAFLELGGVCRYIQVDNARQFVKNASVNNFQWNDAFLKFCGYYSIEPTRSMPYYPQSKGKVENPFNYVEHHFIRNNTFESFDDFYKKLKIFQEDFNNRKHSRINATPNELFDKEKEFLLPVSSDSISLSTMETRKVTSDCLIAYKGNRYSVPYYFSGGRVWIRPHKGAYLNIYSQEGKLIAKHLMPRKKGNIILDKGHYKNINQTTFDGLKAKFLERFNDYKNKDAFLKRMKEQKRINPAYHLMRMLAIFDYYDNSQCISVMDECIKFNLFNYHFVKGLIQKHDLKKESVALYGVDIPQKNIKRDMKEYEL